MVFAGVYPADGSDYEALCSAVERLTCNDASVSIAKESSGALGIGFRFCSRSFTDLRSSKQILIVDSDLLFAPFVTRCGFLGLLHMDVFHQRLEQVISCTEHGLRFRDFYK